MSKFGVLMMAVVVAVCLGTADAQAKRLGGGKSIGKQSPNVTQREAVPNPPPAAAGAAPVTPAAQAAAPGALGQAAQQPARNRWLGPLAGIAAGIGLAALASHFGFGEGFATIMMVMLFGLIAFAVIRMVMARRTPAVPRPLEPKFTYSGIGQEAAVPNYPSVPAAAREADVVRPPRPLGQAAGTSNPSSWHLPADFDVDAFLRQAKSQYVRMQTAFDAANFEELREFTSPEMFAQLKLDIEDRKGSGNHTDVVTLDGQLLGIESTPGYHMASVRFTGMVREAEGSSAEPFDEVWNLSKPVDGSSGWVLAGVQQFH